MLKKKTLLKSLFITPAAGATKSEVINQCREVFPYVPNKTNLIENDLDRRLRSY